MIPMPIAPRNAPYARKEPVERTIHGVRVVDDYGWMRAANWREVMRDPKVLAKDIRDHLKAENAYSAE